MALRVFITGKGIISAIGINCSEVLIALAGEKTGIGQIHHLESIYRNILPVAEVRLDDSELAQIAGIPDTSQYTRTALLGIVAASEAFHSAGLDKTSSGKLRIGLVSASSVGGMDRSEHFYSAFRNNPDKGRLRDIINHDCGDSTEKIASFLGIDGYLSTISTACSSSANSIMHAARLIKAGILDIAVAGGTDALTIFTLNGFNSLMILDKNPCRPFDENRNGLTLGEGAGYIVLESESSALKRNKELLFELKGYGNACDAFHQTASSPEGKGALLAMNQAFEIAGIDPSETDYVNVHGTGTQNNDLSEGTALKTLFGGKLPYFSSTKSYTGHTLGAAGGVEAVISLLSMENNLIFPNLNFSTPIKELGLTPATSVIRHPGLKHILSNSFGFGGNNSALIFSRN